MHDIITNFDRFDELWDLISDFPFSYDITDSMMELIMDALDDPPVVSRPKGDYVIFSEKNDKVICIAKDAITKHFLGWTPRVWDFINVDFIDTRNGSGPIYIISDLELFKNKIFNMAKNRFVETCSDQVRKDEKIYRKILENRNVTLKRGDMVHIPVYDAYSGDHGTVHRFVLIFDGENLLPPLSTGDDYGLAPLRSMEFPEFDIPHFTVLGRHGELLGG